MTRTPAQLIAAGCEVMLIFLSKDISTVSIFLFWLEMSMMRKSLKGSHSSWRRLKERSKTSLDGSTLNVF